MNINFENLDTVTVNLHKLNYNIFFIYRVTESFNMSFKTSY